MNFKLTDKGPKLNEKKIAAFESRYDLALPSQYRLFLLRTNGGIPSPDVSFPFVEDGEQYHFIRCESPDDSPVWAIDLGALRVRPKRFRGSLIGWLRA